MCVVPLPVAPIIFIFYLQLVLYIPGAIEQNTTHETLICTGSDMGCPTSNVSRVFVFLVNCALGAVESRGYNYVSLG
jgi:hypothetical protein